MKKPIASAKPNEHKVYVGKKVYVYSRIRKRELTQGQIFLKLMHQIAKVTLRRVKQIVKNKSD